MPAKFNLYSAWMDPYFYAWALVFAAALFAMVYSIRRYLELKNSADFPDPAQDDAENPFVEEAVTEEVSAAPSEQPPLAAEPQAGPEPAPEEALPADTPEPTPAENFVRGIYSGISDLDSRMKGIEAALSKNHVNNDFTVKFLEDILQDMDSLDKVKIKARIEYLLSDLKK